MHQISFLFCCEGATDVIGFAFTELVVEVKSISCITPGYNILLIPNVVISFPIGQIGQIEGGGFVLFAPVCEMNASYSYKLDLVSDHQNGCPNWLSGIVGTDPILPTTFTN